MSSDVLILGSKPESIVPKTRYIYAANASGFFYRNEIPKDSILKVVLTVAKIYSSDDCSPRPHLENIMELPAKEFIVMSSPGKLACVESLRAVYADKKISVITGEERKKIFRDVLHSSSVFSFPAPFFLFPPSNLRNIWFNSLIIKEFFAYMLFARDGKIKTPHSFKMSSGTFALAYAIKDLPSAKRYVISGIGVGGRDKYISDGVRKNVGDKSQNHVEADMAFLKKVAKKYPLFTTDRELSKLTGIPLYELG